MFFFAVGDDMHLSDSAGGKAICCDLELATLQKVVHVREKAVHVRILVPTWSVDFSGSLKKKRALYINTLA